MELKVKQDKLARALNAVSRITSTGKTALPVLTNVLIKANKKKVTLSTTNLDMAVIDYLPVSEAKDGEITVPARLLADFVTNLPRGEVVEIKTDGEKVTIKAGDYHSTINGVSAEDFPELPDIDEKKAVIFKMPVEVFKKGLGQVMVAASSDLTRPALTGVYFNTYKGALYIAATDGYRLTNLKFIDKVKSEIEAIVPSSSLQEVMRSINDEAEEIEILFDEAQAKFRLGEIEVTSKLIDAKFPNYRQLIPKDSAIKMELEQAELLRVVKLAALFARSTDGSIICETSKKEGNFSVASVANEFGENASEIKTKVNDDTRVVVNSRYLIDAINALDGPQVKIGMSTNKAEPVVIQNANNQDYTHIVMPLTI